MPIDTTVPESPGWWMLRLARKLEERQKRLDLLSRYYEGDPPLPDVSPAVKEVYKRFVKKSRTNFAELVVEAPRERMQVTGFRMADSDDTEGDAEANRIWRDNNLPVDSAEVHEHMLALGDGYVIVGPPEDWQSPDDPGTSRLPIITSEDPRLVVTAHDPVRQSIVRAGLKMFHDPEQEKDFVYLYLRGTGEGNNPNASIWVASRERKARKNPAFRFNASTFDIDEALSTEQLPFIDAPIVRFRNRRGKGEFESHTDLLDRINHMVLQRLVIATLQAFRQRALETPDSEAELPETDEEGNEINWDEVFVADPGAIWKLPEGTKLWESEQVDLQGILESVKEDVRHLAAVTRTPINYLNPDAANQSAEGASLMREGLVYKTEDRQTRAGATWTQVMRLGFLWIGDEERAQPGALRTMWAPAERYSLAERADAISKVSNVLPWRTLMTDVMQFSPVAVDRMVTERLNDAFVAGLGQDTTEDGNPIVGGVDMVEFTELIGALIRAGYTPESARRAVLGRDPNLLEHSGKEPVTVRETDAGPRPGPSES